jgi:hypothetical protein
MLPPKQSYFLKKITFSSYNHIVQDIEVRDETLDKILVVREAELS